MIQAKDTYQTFVPFKEGSEGKKQAMEIAEEARYKPKLAPSFANQLFMGKFDLKLIHPFPKQSLEEKQIGDAFIADLMDFLKKNLDPDQVDKTYEIPKKVIEGMAELGVFALKIPKEYGGLGLSQTNYNRVIMQVASYCASTSVLISAHQSIGVPQPLMLFGTKEQKEKYLPKFRKGWISAFALTEMDVGSDPAQMKAEAVLSNDGKNYILNGTKLWCTNGTIANVIVVMAKTAPKIINGKEKKQISAFIVEMDSKGVEVVQRCEFMGLHGIYNGVIQFTDVLIPKENLISKEGRGLAIALATINVGRLTLPGGCTGGAKQCLTIARKWGKERVQWGQSIGLHEAGREKLSYIAATTFAMEAVTWLTSAWADQKNIDIRMESAMAKLFCTEALWKIADLTLQLRGGRGFETAVSLKKRGEAPLPVERILRDSRINTILEGSSEIMKLFLAREAIDPHLQRLKPLLEKLPLSKKIKEIGKILGFYSLWYPFQVLSSFKLSSYSEMKSLKKHFRYIEKRSHKLSRALFLNMAKYQQGLEKKQMLLARLIEIGTDLFIMTAVLSFALQQQKTLIDKTPIELADYFCCLARVRIEKGFKELKKNSDSFTNLIGKGVIEEQFTWLEEGITSIEP